MSRAAAAVSAALLLLLAATSCSEDGGEAIPPPPTTVVSVTQPPDPPDLSGVQIAEIRGRTTTTQVALTPGKAALTGQVVGPDGPVPGATVRVERIVGDSVGSLEVVTAADGTWRAPPPPPPPDPNLPPPPPAAAPPVEGLLGGRYRVRAWRTPDLALTAPTVLFLGGTEQKQLPLQLSRFSGLAVTSSAAPSTPVVDEPVNIAILVTTRSVDPEGVVRSLGVPGASVSLLGGQGWQVVRSDDDTDDGGRASFQLRCRAEGKQPLAVNVNGNASFTIDVAPCVVPPPSTTSSTPEETSTTSTTRDDETERTSTTRRSTTTTSNGTTTSTT